MSRDRLGALLRGVDRTAECEVVRPRWGRRAASDSVSGVVEDRRPSDGGPAPSTEPAPEGTSPAAWLAELPELLERLAPALHAERRRLGISDERDSDLVQTLALLALQNGDRVRNPPAWLWGTFRNLCRLEVRDRVRWDAVRERLTLELPEPTSGYLDTDRAIELEQRLAPVRERSRRALELHYVEGLTLEETARRLGFAVSSMKRTLHRALRIARRAADSG